MNNPNIDALIGLLKKHELTIAALYDQFALNLPQAADDWQTFVKEEQLHAKWIDKLHQYLKAGKLSFEQTKFTTQSVKTAISYIENQIEKNKKDKPGLRQSLTIAIDIEKSLLESAFFKVFNLDDPKADKIRNQLIDATKTHVNKLMEWQSSID